MCQINAKLKEEILIKIIPNILEIIFLFIQQIIMFARKYLNLYQNYKLIFLGIFFFTVIKMKVYKTHGIVYFAIIAIRQEA